MRDDKCSCDKKEGFPAKARFEENGFEHIISFSPGHLCERFLADRNDPHNHGKACVDLLFLVKNKLGAVQFTLLSGWYPEWKKYRYEDSSPFSVLPSDLGYHSPKPMYESQSPMGECSWVEGGQCYYDGSSLNAEKPFDILIMQGETALWRFLEDYHRQTFSSE